jgi:hypothetical protein
MSAPGERRDGAYQGRIQGAAWPIISLTCLEHNTNLAARLLFAWQRAALVRRAA